MMRTRVRGEQGASLLIILVLVALMAVFVTAIGTQGIVGSTSTAAVRTQRTDMSRAKNAINAAVNYLRANASRGREGVAPCDSNSTVLTYAAPATGVAPPATPPPSPPPVTVSCKAQGGSGLPQDGDNFPGYSLLTMDPTRPGIDVSGNQRFNVDGAVWSNSSINVGNNLIFDAGNDLVGTTGACNYGNASSQIVATPLLCNSGLSVADPGGTGDPATGPWASTLQTLPPLRAVPTCADLTHYNPVSHVMRLDPGYYEDATSLSALTSSTGCGGPVVLWLAPGAFYFDFATTNTLWNISGGFLIGGTASGWDPASTTVDQRIAIGANFTTRAANGETTPPTCDRSSNGVELVFGGESHLQLSSPGRVELCPTPSTTTQETVIYGRKAGSAVQQTYVPTAVSCTPIALACSPQAPLLQIENTGASNTTASYTVTDPSLTQVFTSTGYDLSAIPPGSILNAVNVRVGHQEGSSSNNWSLGARVKVGGVDICTGATAPTVAIPVSTSLTVASPSCRTNYSWSGPAAVSVEYSVRRSAVNGCNSNNGNCKEILDGVELDVTYTPPPGLRPQSGCVTASVSPCAFLNVDNTGGANEAALYVWGTMYTPRGGLTANFKNKSQFQFGRGAVVRWFTGTDIPAAQLFDAFTVGNQFAYADRLVELSACIPAATPCDATSPNRRLRALVRFQDFGITVGSTPDVSIERWTAVN